MRSMTSSARYALAMTVFAGAAVALVSGQQPVAPVYTAAQAAAGRELYTANCASCHTDDLGGRNEAPALAGPAFMSAWRTRSTKELYDYMKDAMPPAGAALTGDQYAQITSYVLQQNSAAAGPSALTATTAVPIGTIATGQRPAAAQTAAAAPAGRGQAADGAAPAGRGQAGGRGAAGAAPAVAGGRGAAGAPGGRGGPAPPARGLTVAGEVKNYVPVTDAMLRNPDPGDWLMARRNYQGWSYSPLGEINRGNVKDLQARVGLADERDRRESADAARAQRDHVSREHAQHRAGPRREDRRPHLGKPHRAGADRRLRIDAELRDLRGQDHHGHHRRAPRRARRAHRKDRVGNRDRRSREGALGNERSDRGKGHRGPGPPGLRPLQRRRSLLHQRLRREYRQAEMEVLHHRAQRRARRRHVGEAPRRDARGRRNVDCRQLRSRPEPHLLGNRAGQTVDAGEPR